MYKIMNTKKKILIGVAIILGIVLVGVLTHTNSSSPSFEDNLATARLYQDQNRFKEAEGYYTRSLGQATSPEERADILNNLGIVQDALNDYTQAEASLTEALQIRRELAVKNPQAYLPDVAMTLNNLGYLYQNTNNYPQAEASLTEALQIQRELAGTNPQAYLPYVAMTLNNLGNLQTDNNHYIQAEKSYTEALQIRRELAKKNSQAYQPNVATTLNNLGLLQANTNNYAQAKESYVEALQIRRELAEKNPQAYQPKVAMILYNLSLLYQGGTPNKALSLQYAKEAIEVLNRCNDTPWVRDLRKDANGVIDDWAVEN
jgi:tetratricopeptide (TPR) repeat protein